MVSRLDLVVLDSSAAGYISSTPLGFLEYWGIYRAKRRSGGHPRWAQPTRACPGGLFLPRGTPQVQPGPNVFLLAHKKSSWSFVAFGLRLVLIFCDVKNME